MTLFTTLFSNSSDGTDARVEEELDVGFVDKEDVVEREDADPEAVLRPAELPMEPCDPNAVARGAETDTPFGFRGGIASCGCGG